MSKKAHLFTPQTAPRAGGKPGRKVKLSGQALQILDKLLVDWQKHGAAVLRTLRIERPELYAKLALDVASRVVLNDAIEDTGPSLLIVKWGDPKSPPPPLPEPIREFSPTAPTTPSPQHDPILSEPPPRGPMQMPRLLSFERPLD